jgi:ribosomal protein L37AE/L43A
MTIHPFPKTPSVAAGATAAELAISCPSCHTARSAAAAEAAAAGGWMCQRCGQQWTASRLATVAEYEAWNRLHS